jgi:hypothetical protein
LSPIPTFQIQPFHKGLAIQADVAFSFMPGAERAESCTGTPLRKIKSWTDYLMAQDLIQKEVK